MQKSARAGRDNLGRREFTFGVAGAAAALALGACESRRDTLERELTILEASAGGRLGLCVFEPGSGAAWGHRIGERFPLCSTFKLALAGLILREIDQNRLRADHFVRYSAADFVPYAPVTERNLAEGGMTVIALAEAAQVTSDNVAANLLLKLLDGPAGFTALLRSIGDLETRLDRYEPALNFVPVGEERDTTTPRAMARTAADLALGDVLLPESRARLFGWMKATETGLNRLRAGFPASWSVGDKTGTAYAEGMNSQYNDIAVVARPEGDGLVVTSYYEADGEYESIRAVDEAVLASAARIVASAAD